MKWSSCALTVLLTAGACSSPASRAVGRANLPAAPAFVRVGVKEGNRVTIRKVPFETYVQATIISEFAPPAGDPRTVERMYEVQAVIGRTYALAHLGRHAADGFDLCSTTHCQLFEPARLKTSRWAAQTEEATKNTSGAVLWFDGAPARALFHADCGGRTSRADDVWGGRGQPYLASIDDDGPAEDAHAPWRYESARAALIRALNAGAQTRVGARLESIEIVERDAAGRAERIALRGEEERVVRGEVFRDALTRAFGARTVKSTRFDITRRGTAFVFEGRGFGHGVGLCQAGALARLRSGVSPPAILQRYFPGTRLVTLRRPRL